MSNIAEIVKKYREDSGLKSAELAEKIGVSQATISLIENGKRKPSKEILERIFEVLNIPFSISGKDNEQENNNINQIFNKEVNYTKGKIYNLNVGTNNTEVIIEMSTEIANRDNLDNLSTKELEYIQRAYAFESSIIVDTLAEFMNSHEGEIKDLIFKNLQSEIEKLKIQYLSYNPEP